jgi:hypothetical protein
MQAEGMEDEGLLVLGSVAPLPPRSATAMLCRARIGAWMIAF